MRNRKLTVALLLIGTTGFAGFARAEVTAPVAPAQNAVKLDDAKSEGEKTESVELQHLRAARKMLNEAKDTFEKDPVDKADHRKEAIQGIDMAIKGIDDEIVEMKADMKK